MAIFRYLQDLVFLMGGEMEKSILLTKTLGVQDQTKWLVFRMIHGSRIPDPIIKGQSLVDLDFLGKHLNMEKSNWRAKIVHLPSTLLGVETVRTTERVAAPIARTKIIT